MFQNLMIQIYVVEEKKMNLNKKRYLRGNFHMYTCI